MTRDWVWPLTSDLNPQSTLRSLLCWRKKTDALKITYNAKKGLGTVYPFTGNYLNTHWENRATYAQWNTLKDWKQFLWPKSLAAKEMQIKMTIWYPSIPSRVPIIAEQVEKGKTGNTKSSSYHGTVWYSSKSSAELSSELAIPLLGLWKHLGAWKCTHVSVTVPFM